VTAHPSAEWIARQLTEACGWSERPHYTIRDRDVAYGGAFIQRLTAMGIRDRPISARSPWQNGLTEAARERRYLTVMFCDLFGSTGIAAQLDAGEWRDLVGADLDAAAVMEMGGHVAKKLGDWLMALFGYPLAHENDAERAARAAGCSPTPEFPEIAEAQTLLAALTVPNISSAFDYERCLSRTGAGTSTEPIERPSLLKTQRARERSPQLIEQRLDLLQIQRVEALG
jgi:hypothetical protein